MLLNRRMTLGDVGRASTDQFAGKRKLFLVPFVSAVRPEEEYQELVSRYWSEVSTQVRNLERSLGSVARVFHEGTTDAGENALSELERGNPPAGPFLKETVERGASVQAVEDAELLKETLDLHRCLLVVQESQKVAQRVSEWFADVRRQRYETISRRINEALGANEVGLLVISPDHQVQFPEDVQVLYVSPPAFDEIGRWLRDHPYPQQPEAGEGSEVDAGSAADAAAGEEAAESGAEGPSDRGEPRAAGADESGDS